MSYRLPNSWRTNNTVKNTMRLDKERLAIIFIFVFFCLMMYFLGLYTGQESMRKVNAQSVVKGDYVQIMAEDCYLRNQNCPIDNN